MSASSNDKGFSAVILSEREEFRSIQNLYRKVINGNDQQVIGLPIEALNQSRWVLNSFD